MSLNGLSTRASLGLIQQISGPFENLGMVFALAERSVVNLKQELMGVGDLLMRSFHHGEMIQ